MLDLRKDIKTVKVTKDPNSYSMLLYGRAKLGKSTFVKQLYGDKVLMLMTEPRDRGLAGAHVAHVNNWTDFVMALSQLKASKELHKRFSVISIDTVDNLVQFVEDYVKSVYDEKQLGEKADFGKDYALAKDLWKKYVTSIHGIGYTPVYVSHDKKVKVNVPVSDSAEDNVVSGADKVRDGSNVYYQFDQIQPDLPKKYLNPLNNSADEIVHLGTEIKNGTHRRVLHLRHSPQWVAGSTFPNIAPVVPMDAKAYRKALTDAVNSYGSQDKTTAKYNKVKRETPFKDLMMTAKKLGYKLATNGKRKTLKKITDDVFGVDVKLMESTPNQRQQVDLAIAKMRKVAKEL